LAIPEKNANLNVTSYNTLSMLALLEILFTALGLIATKKMKDKESVPLINELFKAKTKTA
jgi:hypothetical protein